MTETLSFNKRFCRIPITGFSCNMHPVNRDCQIFIKDKVLKNHTTMTQLFGVNNLQMSNNPSYWWWDGDLHITEIHCRCAWLLNALRLLTIQILPSENFLVNSSLLPYDVMGHVLQYKRMQHVTHVLSRASGSVDVARAVPALRVFASRRSQNI